MSSQSGAQDRRPGAPTGDLAAELAKGLDELVSVQLDPDEVRDLLDGLATVAAAMTRVLDDLRTCPVLRERENELGLLAFQTIHSKLEQAAAAAEDLEVSMQALCRLLPAPTGGGGEQGGRARN